MQLGASRFGSPGAGPGFSAPSPRPKTTLLTALRAKLRMGHYSARTEEAYAFWVRRFIRFYRHRHPKDLGPIEVAEFCATWPRNGGPRPRRKPRHCRHFYSSTGRW